MTACIVINIQACSHRSCHSIVVQQDIKFSHRRRFRPTGTCPNPGPARTRTVLCCPSVNPPLDDIRISHSRPRKSQMGTDLE